MGKNTIFRGNTANDGSGDNLRLGAQKINDNFTEVYTALGDGSTLASGTYVTTVSTHTFTNKTISGASNTLSNIPNSALDTIANNKLTNSTITITGDGAGTSAVDLGDTITFEGGSGITTTVTADKVSFQTDGSIVTETSTDILTNKTIDGTTNTLQNIANASLTNSSIGIGGLTLNLGDTDATPALDLTDATNYPTSSLSGTITNTQLAGSITNDKLVNKKITIGDDTSTNFDVQLGDSFEIIGGSGLSTAIDNNRITLSVGNLPNTSLDNSSITLGSDTIALGGTQTSIAGLSLTGSGNVDLVGAGSKMRFDFSGYGALPAAATYVGMYSYDSVGNRPYYSSGSGWVRILDENSSVSTHTDVNTSGVADKNVLQFSSAQGRFNVAEGPKLLQQVNYQSGGMQTGTTIFPEDDTIPQNSEGSEFMTLAITPKSATSTLVMDVQVFYSQSVGTRSGTGIFKDSDADALAFTSNFCDDATMMTNMHLNYSEVSGNTTARTYKVRCGNIATAGTFTFNGQSGARKFGGTILSTFRIIEIDS